MLAAVGGGTNAVVHLLALAGRVGVPLTLDRFGEVASQTPLLVNVRPSGEHLVEQLHHAGGVPAVLKELAPLLDGDALTVTGRPLADGFATAEALDRDVVATLDAPLGPPGAISVVRGSLAPSGALVKRSAASPHLLRHRGAALVFEDVYDVAARIDDPALEVRAEDILVLQNAGPHAPEAMPEAGYLPIPKKLAQKGIKDMVRISDARMSGTAFGTIVLHVTPDAASGGPLGLVRNGDRIRLSVKDRRIELLVDEAELNKRVAPVHPETEKPTRGYSKLYAEQILGADVGCDFAFLRPQST